jgi:hypothetical protein
MFRSTAQLTAPAVVSGSLAWIALPVGIAALALVTAAPGLLLRGRVPATDTGQPAGAASSSAR